MKNKLFLSMLTLLGFGGCTNEEEELYDTPDMYGVPTTDYQYIGEVSDAEGNPINGIKIYFTYSLNPIQTDENGAFEKNIATVSGYSEVLTFTDEDGEENGGEFATKQVSVSWSEYEYIDGQYVCDLGTVTLEPKEEE